MPRLSANLSMLYTELPFLDRIGAAAADGFRGVEYLGPYDHPPEDVVEALRAAGVEQVLFNLPSGDWGAGERGIAALAGREEEFRDGVEAAILYARALGCSRLNCLAGVPPDGDRERAEAVLASNLRYAAERLEGTGISLLLEPINDRDIPGFFVTRPEHALNIIERAEAPGICLQWDFYHVQVMQGDLLADFERHLPRIGHVQIADNPGRGEPGTGEINYSVVLPALDRLGWSGWVGCEYRPVAGTRAGLGWRDALIGGQWT